MVICTYSFVSSKKNAQSIREILNSIKVKSRFQLGCISFKIWREEENPSVTILYQEWHNVDYLKKYLFSQEYRRLLFAMELCKEKPIVKVVDSDSIHNFSWLEQELSKPIERV